MHGREPISLNLLLANSRDGSQSGRISSTMLILNIDGLEIRDFLFHTLNDLVEGYEDIQRPEKRVQCLGMKTNSVIGHSSRAASYTFLLSLF